jgi:hypothetical protein
LDAAELKKIVLRLPQVLSYNHDNLVHEKLAPLQAFLDLNAAELKKIVLGYPVLGYPAVLGLVPANMFTKLRHQQECLGLMDEELRVAVIAQSPNQWRWATGKSRRSGR